MLAISKLKSLVIYESYFYILSFIIKCEWKWISRMCDPLPKIVKVKDDKFLGTCKNRNKW